MTTPGPAHMAALGQMNLRVLTADERANLAKYFGVHASALDPLAEHARRVSPPPAPAAGPQKVSDAEFASMSSAERLDYARQFDQSQFQGST